MDRLTLWLTILSAAAIAGALIAVCASYGYTSIWAIGVCIVLAISIAYPGARIAARGARLWQSARKNQARSTKTDPTE